MGCRSLNSALRGLSVFAVVSEPSSYTAAYARQISQTYKNLLALAAARKCMPKSDYMLPFSRGLGGCAEEKRFLYMLEGKASLWAAYFTTGEEEQVY